MDNFKRLFALTMLTLLAVETFSETKRSLHRLTRTVLHKTERPVPQSRYPWHVFILSVKCSGVFIHERWILTSASCVSHWESNYSSAGWFPVENSFANNRATLFVRVGNHHIDFEIPGVDAVPVLKTLTYPGYNPGAIHSNVGLLYLARKVVLPKNNSEADLSVISLPDAKSFSSFHSTDPAAKVLGWGHESAKHGPFRRLYQNDVTLTNSEVCFQRFENDSSPSWLGVNRWLCILAGTKGMCSIDQGSPVIVKRNDSWIVLGIYSRGQPCATGESNALFTRIDSKVLKWIRQNFKVKDKPQCKRGGYKVLDTAERVLFNKVNNDTALCDSELTEAWYRLEINGFPTEIPTTCPVIGSCGTHAQIWLQPDGHPSFGEEKQGRACVAWNGVERICCMWQFPIHVTHCGDFLVYRLKPTEGCPMAYCAKEALRVPCGPGKIGYVPRCKGSPRITPVVPPDKNLASLSVHLLCVYDIEHPGSYHAGFKVTWYKIIRFIGGRRGKVVLLTNKTVETAAVISSVLKDFHLGDTIVCEVMTYYAESPDIMSPGLESRDFLVGVKIEPSFVVLSENHKAKELTVSLTVPLVCPPANSNCTLQIPLHLVPAVPSPRSLLTPDIALSICEVTLRPQTCSRRDCGRKLVWLVAVSDFIDDGDRRTQVITGPTTSQSPLWNSLDTPDVFVLTKNVRTSRCYIFTESYIKTLAGRYYRIPAATGAFIMYKRLARPFEIHVRFWSCTESGNPSFCACGVAMRDGDDVIEMNMCDGGFAETSAQISIKSKLPLTKGVRITESDAGKRYTVYFPSGSFVRADVFEWGLNLYVQSSGRDVGRVSGLCSEDNDQNDRKETDEGLPRLMSGVQRWRLSHADSLFEYKLPLKRHHRTEKFFCLCGLSDILQKKTRCETLGKSCESKCRRHQHILWPTLSRERDITKRVEALQARRFLEQRQNTSTEFSLPAVSLHEQPGPLPEQHSDSLLAVLVVFSYCKRLLTDTDLGRACRVAVGQRKLDQLLKICIRDMRYTGVSSIAWGVVAVLKDLCEELTLKNTSAWEVSSNTGHPAPPKKLTMTMCPRLCSDRGRCMNGTCKCRRGYTSDDCSVPTRSPPEVISVHGNGQCNIRSLHCRQVRVVGEGFLSTRNLKCSFTAVKFLGNNKVSMELKSLVSKATFETYRSVICEVPQPDEGFRSLHGYQVRLSNDGKLWSRSLPFVILNGHCLTCNRANFQCNIKIGTCFINGRCLRSGESSFRDPCKWCSPNKNQTAWTDIQCQAGMCETSTCARGHCIDTFAGKYFCFCDVGFTGPRCDIPETDPCMPTTCGNGSCVPGERTFRCICPFGLTGEQCSVPIDPCASNPCLKGTCVVRSASQFECSCSDGYTGQFCEIRLPLCLCQRGRCVRNEESSTCSCPTNFTGEFCEIPIDVCSSMPCRSGTCIERNGSAKCLCYPEYTGTFCDVTIQNKCVNEDGPCKCPQGVTGSHCNENIDYCLSNPCINGDCMNLKTSFKCECHDNFGGTFCDTEIVNPCQTNPCEKGRCVSVQAVVRTGPIHKCVCDDGFTGASCETEIDPCKDISCKNGVCRATDSQLYRCTCFKGFTGHQCESEIDFCLSRPCYHGSCLNKNGSFACVCDPGYTGNVCDEAVDLCQSNPCKHGTCKQTSKSIVCSCRLGYTGVLCETKINYCRPSPCRHGICLSSMSSFQCLCHRGHSGDLCDRLVTLCEPNPCKHGTCYSHYSLWFSCRCKLGYTGRLCDREINMCDPNPCANGTCINLGMSFRCRCPSGFHGRLCNQIDSCQSSPCRHGTCEPTGSSFKCRCYESYIGRLCERKTNACRRNPCGNGRCQRVGAFFRCVCLKGYSGKRCEVLNDPCSHHRCKKGTCLPQDQHYICQCPRGFTGKHCERDVNECLNSPCFSGVHCTNYPGSFRCGSCPFGLTGNGTYCDKVSSNDCATLSCFKNVSCVKINEKYQCGACPPGFTGNGVTCTEMNACYSNPCHPLVQCHTERGSKEFQCGPCPAGYTGNGTTCNSLCSVPCPFGMKCVSHLMCRCPEGFYGVGCRKPFCRAGCYNGGQCISPDVCRCVKGFAGQSCLTPICQPPCGSRGKCVTPGKCQCRHGFTGSRCQKKHCLVSCLNGGSCIGPYVCRCMPGYSGQRCEIAPCTPKCKNGGWCATPNTCKCLPAYVGNRCQYSVCSPPCINGGHCIRPNVCMCPSSWKGDRCQKPVCSLPCLNGGRCARPHQCTCASGYVGMMCERALCDQPCLNGGQCVRPGVCACPFGFSGRRCERKDS